jgi:hypothetical protein
MYNGDQRNMENKMYHRLRRLVTSLPRQKSLEKKNHSPNNPIPSILRLDSKFREVSFRAFPTISVFGLDFGYYKHVDSIPQKEIFQNFQRIEESKKKDLQKESYSSEDLSKIYWNVFSNKNPNFQSVFIPQMNVSM